MNALIQKSYFRKLPPEEQKELWDDRLQASLDRPNPAKESTVPSTPISPGGRIPIDPHPLSEPEMLTNYHDETERFRIEREKLQAEREKLEVLRKGVMQDEEVMSDERRNAIKRIKEAIEMKITNDEREKILDEFKWGDFRLYNLRVLLVKRQSIVKQRQNGKQDLEKWKNEVAEWEAKNKDAGNAARGKFRFLETF